MRIALKISGQIIFYLLLALFVILIFFGAASRIYGGSPTIFGQRMLIVMSGSMEPKIHTGSVIFDNPNVRVDSLKVGNIITFKPPTNPNILITHRIYRIVKHDGQEGFMTKGDANTVQDGWIVPASNIVATYDHFTIPYLGYYLDFIKTRMGIALVLIIPGAFLIISQVFSLIRTLRKETADKNKSVEVKPEV